MSIVSLSMLLNSLFCSRSLLRSVSVTCLSLWVSIFARFFSSARMARCTIPSPSASSSVSEASSHTLGRTPSPSPLGSGSPVRPVSGSPKFNRPRPYISPCKRRSRRASPPPELAPPSPASPPKKASPSLSSKLGSPSATQAPDDPISSPLDSPDRTLLATYAGTMPEILADRLSHHNITSGLDLNEIGKNSSRNRGFVDGETLEHLIHSRKIPEGLPTKTASTCISEALCWLTLLSLLDAVDYLHFGHRQLILVNNRLGWQPIIHNFMNPANILYAPDGADPKSRPLTVCRLGNFSRSIVLPSTLDPIDGNEVDDRREAFASIRTTDEVTGYEAPEILGEGGKAPGLASDLWSIGAVMVAMMTGRTVWDLVLEVQFANLARRSQRRGKIRERWRDVPLVARHALLLSMASDATIALALPRTYGDDLRLLTESLLVLNPDNRGVARDVLLHAVARCEKRKAALPRWEMESARKWEQDLDLELILNKYDRVAQRARRLLAGR